MVSMPVGITPRRMSRMALIFFWMQAFICLSSSAQQPVRGTIAGTVTADQGAVIGFRVAAHNLDRRLWYTVFTNKGRYVVPQALPGRYEIMVYEPAYDSPKLPAQLDPGESKTLNFAIKKKMPGPDAANNGGGRIEYVARIEDIFPPGPGLDELKKNCTGCHFESFNGFPAMHFTKERYLEAIERMTETGPGYNPYVLALGHTPINKKEKNLLAEYLATNFGPGTVEKRLRLDPLVLDEEIASKAIYVSYDVPADLPMPTRGNVVGADMVDGVIPQMPPNTTHHLQAAYISPVDGSLWFTSHSNSLLRLDTKSLDPVARWKNYPIKGDPFVQPSGIAIDKEGRVYWAELKAGLVGELDPATGKQIRHAMPELIGAIEEVVVDKDDNIDFGLIWGSAFGRIDAKTRKIHMYPTPTPDNGIYGLAVDQHGNMWGGGWQKGMINEWNAETEEVKEYKVPDSWGQVRRIGVDSKGIVWAAEYPSGRIARLDPTNGELSEFRIPLNGAKPYEAWTDKQDYVWTSDQPHSAMIKLDPKSGKFAFYPMPQPFQSVPKIQVAEDNTIWFGTRNIPIATAVHFYPNGYTAEAPPLP